MLILSFSLPAQSELEAFKASIPQTETILAEWFLKTLHKGRLLHTPRIGSNYMLLCSDTALYMLKLTHKRSIHSHQRYSLLDFTNIQVIPRSITRRSEERRGEEKERGRGHVRKR
jgi:hypothetical protein